MWFSWFKSGALSISDSLLLLLTFSGVWHIISRKVHQSIAVILPLKSALFQQIKNRVPLAGSRAYFKPMLKSNGNTFPRHLKINDPSSPTTWAAHFPDLDVSRFNYIIMAS
jgi:hypothetical protein